MEKEIQKGYLALGIVSLFWGTTFAACKIGNTYMPAVFLAGLRQFVTGVILTTFFLYRKHQLPSRIIFKKIFVQAILLLFIGNCLLTWSLKFISSGLAAILSALVPIMIALFSILLNKSPRISRLMFVGLALGLLGVCIIFSDYLGDFGNPSFIKGIALAFISIAGWSLGSVYSSRQNIAVPVLFSVGLQMFISGTMLLVICFTSGEYVNLLYLPVEGWYAIIYLIIVGSIIAYSAYIFALNKLSPTLVSIYAYINPIVAIFLGWFLLKEKINIHMIPGVFIVFCGVYIVNREFNKRKILL